MPEKSSSALQSATGHDYEEWFRRLDDWGAPGRAYRAIADWLVDSGMSEWWAQKVIVEYEHARGLRQPGARKDGTFTAGASKTVLASPATVFAAVMDADVRRRWLPDLALTERTSTSSKSARFDAADGTRIHVTIVATGDAKCTVGIEQAKLPDADLAARARTEWRDRLAALKLILER